MPAQVLPGGACGRAQQHGGIGLAGILLPQAAGELVTSCPCVRETLPHMYARVSCHLVAVHAAGKQTRLEAFCAQSPA